jgi:membrane protein DedA with SNARE-associated domain
MELGPFTVYTFLGCIPWCFGLAGIGWAIGRSWHRFHSDFRYAEYAVLAAAVAVVAWLIWRWWSARTARRAAELD